MTMRITLITSSVMFMLSSCNAQIEHVRTVTVYVNGDGDECEKTIEKAAFVKGEADADWDVDAKTARLTYDSMRTDPDVVLKRIAIAGYDSERFLAPDAAYAALPDRCRYRRTGKHTAVKSKVEEHGHRVPTARSVRGVAATDTIQTTSPSHLGSDPLNDLFVAYFALKNALVASDGTPAMASAAVFSAAVQAVRMERLDPEVHVVWMQVMEPLSNLAAGLAAKKDIEAKRKAFAELTASMLALVEVAPRSEPVYLDHCPMYEGGADWLSLEKPIKNPFYGSMMLTCGSVKQTIP